MAIQPSPSRATTGSRPPARWPIGPGASGRLLVTLFLAGCTTPHIEAYPCTTRYRNPDIDSELENGQTARQMLLDAVALRFELDEGALDVLSLDAEHIESASIEQFTENSRECRDAWAIHLGLSTTATTRSGSSLDGHVRLDDVHGHPDTEQPRTLRWSRPVPIVPDADASTWLTNQLIQRGVVGEIVVERFTPWFTVDLEAGTGHGSTPVWFTLDGEPMQIGAESRDELEFEVHTQL